MGTTIMAAQTNCLYKELIGRDIFLGNEGFLSEAEKRNAHYLTKLRRTGNVKRLDRVMLGRGLKG